MSAWFATPPAMATATIALGHDEGAFEEMLEEEMARQREKAD